MTVLEFLNININGGWRGRPPHTGSEGFLLDRKLLD